MDIFQLLCSMEGKNLPNPDFIREKIEEDFDKRKGYINDYEKESTMRFLSKDYTNNVDGLATFIYLAEKREPDRPEYKAYINQAWDSIKKAYRDVEVAMKIDPDPQQFSFQNNYENAIHYLKDINRKLYLMSEFPNYYKQLIGLDKDLENAVKEEKFESAATIRDKIDDILSGIKVQQKPTKSPQPSSLK